MSRVQFKENIFTQITAQSALLALLGTSGPLNRLVYNGWPQTQPKLSGQEPSEGWLVFHEEPAIIAEETLYEDFNMSFSIFCTRLSIGEQCIEIIDDLWNWRIPQQDDITYGDNLLVHSKRISTAEEYQDSIKLYKKTAIYWMRTVKSPYLF